MRSGVWEMRMESDVYLPKHVHSDVVYWVVRSKHKAREGMSLNDSSQNVHNLRIDA